MRPFVSTVLAAAFAVSLAAASRAAEIDATMLRFPDVSDRDIVFVYDNDVWIADKNGGLAVPLSSPPGQEVLPRFSPDGLRVAFTGNYDGNLDVYAMPVAGGVPQRLTFAPEAETVVDWSPDGKVLFSSGREQPNRGSNLYLIGLNERLPAALPITYGAFGSFSQDGQWLAFSPWSTEFRTWNRYQGGLASDIWLFNMQTHESRRMTDFPGTDDMPMFHGDKVYFLSDCGQECRRNIWVYDIVSGQREQVTHFDDYDVKWPSIGNSEIVLENGGMLYLLDLATHELRSVHIQLPGDRPHLRAQSIDVSGWQQGESISPGAKRVAVALRGDIWTVPAEEGYSQNLSRTNGVAERDPAWSPDGKQLAYFSDATGEYELYVRAADGTGEPKQLTQDGTCFRFRPVWSPDSKKISFSDKTGAYFIHLVDSGETISVDRDPWAGWGIAGTWAKDSNWFAYAVSDPQTSNGMIRLYDLVNRKSHQVTSPHFNSGSPAFDLNGDYLYFATDRNLEPQIGGLDDGETFYFANSTILAVAPLRKDLASPFAPKNDQDDTAEAKGKGDDKKEPKPDSSGGDKAKTDDEKCEDENSSDSAKSDKKDDKPAELLKIDIEGIEGRAVQVGVPAGNYWGLEGGSGKVFYVRWPRSGSDGGDAQVCMYDLKEEKETVLLAGAGGFDLTPDASKMLVYARGSIFITNAGPGANLDKRVPLGGQIAEIDPRQEWREVVMDTWRIYRDFFYDPKMHGVDWPSVRDRALALVDNAANREDVEYIVAWMVSELNSSHTYVWAAGSEPTRQMSVGLLGCDFALAKDAQGREGYRITKIYQGPEWELDSRGPLSQSGVDVHEGDFLLAVNGAPVDMRVSVYAALAGMAGKPTRITVSDKATIDDTARTALVQPVGWEGELRMRAWIDANRRYVSDKTGGRVGYIYIRNTSWDGLLDLERQFLGQHNMDALVIDERWNGGGFIPHRFIEMLNRPVLSYWARRDGVSWRTPFRIAAGPKVMMINQAAGSGGDAFPYYFRKVGLGKLVGTRTWGGLIGISGNPEPIDGSGLTVPTFGVYEEDGTWAIEGHGVDPDYEVVNDPTSLAEGKDLQLDKAIEVVMQELAEHPYNFVPKPPYPDRSRGGIQPGEK